jgi:hypothetical protein
MRVNYSIPHFCARFSPSKRQQNEISLRIFTVPFVFKDHLVPGMEREVTKGAFGFGFGRKMKKAHGLDKQTNQRKA